MKSGIYALLLGTTAALLVGAQALAAGGCKLDVGSDAPDLGGQDMTGRQIDLSQYRGKWVFVDFWASWCKPCMNELPDVVELSRELGNRDDFAVLSVSLDNEDTLKALMREIERHDIAYPVVYDAAEGSDSNAARWCIQTIPATFLIAPDGTLVNKDVSPYDVRSMIADGQGGSVLNAPPVQRPNNARPSVTARIVPEGRLLDASPSTGQPMYRDLEIALPILTRQPEVTTYQLIVATVETGPEGAPIQRGTKYNLDIRTNPDDPLRPYLVQIQNTTDPKLKEKGELGSLPNMSFVIDNRAAAYKFIVPIPGDTIKYAFKVSLLTEGLANHIDSSTFIVDVDE